MFQLNTGSAGPFRMMDQVGLDVVLDIEEHYCAEHPEYPEGPRRLLRTYIQQGRLGVKSGAGFYDDYPVRPSSESTPKTGHEDNGIQPMAVHALASMSSLTAQCASQAATQSPSWLQVIQAIGSIATAVAPAFQLTAYIQERLEHQSSMGEPQFERKMLSSRVFATPAGWSTPPTVQSK